MEVISLGKCLELVPPGYHDLFKKIAALTDEFCGRHLDDDYKSLSRQMVVALCQRGTPAVRGRAVSWASGVVHALGWVNFLSDSGSEPCMSTREVAEGFGVSESTMMSKSRILREGLELIRLDPDWCVESMLAENPIVWTREIGGIYVDLRQAPRELQVKAYEMGLIPFVHADRYGAELADDVMARIVSDANGDPHISHADADKLRGLTEEDLSSPDAEAKVSGETQSSPRAANEGGKIYVLKVVLLESKPEIWRRVAVPSGIVLGSLHGVIQIAMGWEDYHLHKFTAPDRVEYGAPDPEYEVHSEYEYRLCDIVASKGDRFVYEYDFGDGWEHGIELVEIEDPKPDGVYPVCLAGEQACPPEDSGGIGRYYYMLAAVKDPNHPQHEEHVEWLGMDFDPTAFALDEVNRCLGKMRLNR